MFDEFQLTEALVINNILGHRKYSSKVELNIMDPFMHQNSSSVPRLCHPC